MALRSKFEALKDMNKEQEIKVQYHETKLQNMVSGYLTWGQSFFFFAINSRTFLPFKCTDWWFILASTLVCTFLYFLLFLDAVIVMFRTHDQLDLIRLELMGVCQEILVTQNQDDDDDDVETGEFSSTRGFDDFSFLHKILMLDHVTTTVEKKLYVFFTVCALLAITAIELYASKCLFCN